MQQTQTQFQGAIQKGIEALLRLEFLAVAENADRHPGSWIEQAIAKGLAIFVIEIDPASRTSVIRGRSDHGRVNGGLIAKVTELDPRTLPGLAAGRRIKTAFGPRGSGKVASRSKPPESGFFHPNAVHAGWSLWQPPIFPENKDALRHFVYNQ